MIHANSFDIPEIDNFSSIFLTLTRVIAVLTLKIPHYSRQRLIHDEVCTIESEFAFNALLS